jgi:ribosome-associated toxin RatA of RatAB toxin-antitoxin module
MKNARNDRARFVATPQMHLGSTILHVGHFFVGKRHKSHNLFSMAHVTIVMSEMLALLRVWQRAIGLSVWCALAAVVLPASAAQAQGLPQTQILPDASGQGGRVRASILIPTAPSIVWAVMMDCENAPRFVPNLRACSIESTSRDGSGDVRRHRIAWLTGFPPVTIRFASRYQVGKEIQFERISGDIAQMSGTWVLDPRNNGASTLLTYDAYLVPSRLLPSGLVRSALRRDTPKILEAVRQEAMVRTRAQ